MYLRTMENEMRILLSNIKSLVCSGNHRLDFVKNGNGIVWETNSLVVGYCLIGTLVVPQRIKMLFC